MAKNHKRSPKRPKFTKREAALISQVDQLIAPHGKVTGLGPPAVGVFGDDRYVGLSVTVRFHEAADVTLMSSTITNRVRGVARVLMEI